MDKKNVSKKARKEPKRLKLNIKKILEERKIFAESCKKWVLTEEEDKLMKIKLENIYPKVAENSPVPPKLDLVVDSPKSIIPFNENSYPDTTTACLQRFLILSREQNELQSNIHYNHLINSEWSPKLNDVRSVLCRWGIDLDNVICKPPEDDIIILDQRFERHNFEFVMSFIIQRILRNNAFSNDDLLTLAKFAIAIYLDHDCRQMNNDINQLFSICIEKALNEHSETDIIKYAQELYSKYEAHLVKLIRDLFLPAETQITSKMYTYLTFKLYRSLCGEVDNIIKCPSKNEWFIQDVVDENYFKEIPMRKLKSIFKLLEHVVIKFDLYTEKDKMSDMYDFLYSPIRTPRSQLPKFPKLNYILQQWKIHLFRCRLQNSQKCLYDV